jgi:CheY-like chemotaxis protein
METIQWTGSNNLINWSFPNQSDKPALKINTRISILYADENEDGCAMLKTLLGFSGIEVVCAKTVNEAFQLSQNNHFDLYLLDSLYTDGSGLELCRKLQRLSPSTPIVFYSGAARENERQQGLTAGAAAYLIKPNVETIAPTILQLVARVTEIA